METLGLIEGSPFNSDCIVDAVLTNPLYTKYSNTELSHDNSIDGVGNDVGDVKGGGGRLIWMGIIEGYTGDLFYIYRRYEVLELRKY